MKLMKNRNYLSQRDDLDWISNIIREYNLLNQNCLCLCIIFNLMVIRANIFLLFFFFIYLLFKFIFFFLFFLFFLFNFFRIISAQYLDFLLILFFLNINLFLLKLVLLIWRLKVIIPSLFSFSVLLS